MLHTPNYSVVMPWWTRLLNYLSYHSCHSYVKTRDTTAIYITVYSCQCWRNSSSNADRTVQEISSFSNPQLIFKWWSRWISSLSYEPMHIRIITPTSLHLDTIHKYQVFEETSSRYFQDRINALIIQSEVSILNMEMHQVHRQHLCLQPCTKL